MDLSDWRNEIDGIDIELLHLLQRRAMIVAKIGTIKAAQNAPVIDQEREAQIMNRIESNRDSILSTESAQCVFRCIIEESRRIQTELVGQKTEIC